MLQPWHLGVLTETRDSIEDLAWEARCLKSKLKFSRSELSEDILDFDLLFYLRFLFSIVIGIWLF